MQNDIRRIEFLHHPHSPFQPQPLKTRSSGNPRQRDIRDDVIVRIEAANVAVAPGKDLLIDLLPPNPGFPAQGNIIVEPATFVSGDRVPGAADVCRTLLFDVQSNNGVDGVPQPQKRYCDIEFFQP